MGAELGRMFSRMFILIGLIFGLLPMIFGQCEISVKNVGMNDFTWHIEYANGYIHEKNLTYNQHDNYECACVPHDMKIIYLDYTCYHYMNCINNNDYEVEVTDYAIYINVGHDNVEMCVI